MYELFFLIKINPIFVDLKDITIKYNDKRFYIKFKDNNEEIIINLNQEDPSDFIHLFEIYKDFEKKNKKEIEEFLKYYINSKKNNGEYFDKIEILNENDKKILEHAIFLHYSEQENLSGTNYLEETNKLNGTFNINNDYNYFSFDIIFNNDLSFDLRFKNSENIEFINTIFRLINISKPNGIIYKKIENSVNFAKTFLRKIYKENNNIDYSNTSYNMYSYQNNKDYDYKLYINQKFNDELKKLNTFKYGYKILLNKNEDHINFCLRLQVILQINIEPYYNIDIYIILYIIKVIVNRVLKINNIEKKISERSVNGKYYFYEEYLNGNLS